MTARKIVKSAEEGRHSINPDTVQPEDALPVGGPPVGGVPEETGNPLALLMGQAVARAALARDFQRTASRMDPAMERQWTAMDGVLVGPKAIACDAQGCMIVQDSLNLTVFGPDGAFVCAYKLPPQADATTASRCGGVAICPRSHSIAVSMAAPRHKIHIF